MTGPEHLRQEIAEVGIWEFLHPHHFDCRDWGIQKDTPLWTASTSMLDAYLIFRNRLRDFLDELEVTCESLSAEAEPLPMKSITVS